MCLFSFLSILNYASFDNCCGIPWAPVVISLPRMTRVCLINQRSVHSACYQQATAQHRANLLVSWDARMQTLFPVASYLASPSSSIVHLNSPSQYQLKKHQWWPFSTDGVAAHAHSPVEVGDANCLNRRCHLIWHWLLLVVTRSLSDYLMLKRSPGPKVRGMPSSTIGLSEGSFLAGLVTA